MPNKSHVVLHSVVGIWPKENPLISSVTIQDKTAPLTLSVSTEKMQLILKNNSITTCSIDGESKSQKLGINESVVLKGKYCILWVDGDMLIFDNLSK